MDPTSGTEKLTSQSLLDVLIRTGLIIILAVSCYQIFSPFLNLMLWSVILAVMLYPLQRRLSPKLGNKGGRTATLIVLVAVIILLMPIYLLGASMADSVGSVIAVIRSDGLVVPPPTDAVAAWPLIGKPLHAIWQQAATDLTGLTQEYTPQLKAVALGLLGKLAGFGASLLLFIVALILAGVVMAFGESGHRSAVQAISRFAGADRGPHLVTLCTATIRAVGQGVIGIAFIQMVLIGLGFVMMGVPGAGLLALAVLFLGIIQAPATLITVPVIALVLATDGASVTTIVLSIYVFIAGLVDNVLKPLLLGRGVDVPMPVVLVGALGGMVTGGVVGLFIGPVILAVGYELFWNWVRHPPHNIGQKVVAAN